MILAARVIMTKANQERECHRSACLQLDIVHFVVQEVPKRDRDQTSLQVTNQFSKTNFLPCPACNTHSIILLFYV